MRHRFTDGSSSEVKPVESTEVSSIPGGGGMKGTSRFSIRIGRLMTRARNNANDETEGNEKEEADP